MASSAGNLGGRSLPFIILNIPRHSWPAKLLRLNVKAQKLHPDGSPDATGEKGTQKTAAGRTVDRLENKGRSLRSSKPKGISLFYDIFVFYVHVYSFIPSYSYKF